jgi:Flp pilus assembly protein TadG
MPPAENGYGFQLVKKNDSGASAVEFALIAPLLLLLIFLMVDFARLGFVQLSINSAAREGVRASSFGLTTAEISTISNSAGGTAAQIATNSNSALLQVAQSRSCSDSTALGRTTEVQVSTPFKWLTPIQLITRSLGSQSGKLGNQFTLTATGVMVCAG